MNSSHRYFLFLCLILTAFSNAQSKKAPIAKFSFNDGNEEDEVSEQKAKLVGANFTYDRFGNSNSAVYLSGYEHSYVNLGTYNALKPKNGSISLWIMLTREVFYGQGYTHNPIILTKNAPRDDYYEAYAIYFDPEARKVMATCSNDSLSSPNVYEMKDFNFKSWYHLVMTYDNHHLSFYVNGKLMGTALKDFETKFDPLDSVILGGTANKKNSRYSFGTFDDIEFYDRVLSADEVIELYQAPNPNKNRILLNWILLALGFVTLIIIIYFFIRYRLSLTLKKEKQRLELYNIVLETELRVNRALMNPHFVFNSLNALQNFILKNQNAQANHYLVKFSKLMRRILESNMSDTITLEFEIQLLKSYLEIEDLRFEENIKYSIIVDPGIVPSAIKIPIMMLQPFIENAIWHGLLKKEGEKLLVISFSVVEDKYVCCKIDDNGPGRKKKESINLEKSSLATGFIEQRLNLLNRIHHLNCSMTIEDKPNSAGTVVKILLPILKSKE